MRFYRARLHRRLKNGDIKCLDYYTKRRSLAAARRHVRERYPDWRLLSLVPIPALTALPVV